MEDVEILGMVLGVCENLKMIIGCSDIIFCSFSPKETMYKIFPDFPKEISKKNELIFKPIYGKIFLNEIIFDLWGTVFEKYIYLDNFKGEDNA